MIQETACDWCGSSGHTANLCSDRRRRSRMRGAVEWASLLLAFAVTAFLVLAAAVVFFGAIR